MKTFSIKHAYKRGWELFKGHITILVLVTLTILLVSGIQNGSRQHGHWHSHFSLFGFVIWLALVALSFVLQIGWIKMLLKIEDGGRPEFKEIIAHTEPFWRFIGATIVYGLMVAVGFVLLIVPGIYVMLRYQFVPLIIVDKNKSIEAAFKESARLTKDVKWKLLGFVIVAVLFNIAGVIALGVGLLVTIPVTMLASFSIYRTLEKHHHEHAV